MFESLFVRACLFLGAALIAGEVAAAPPKDDGLVGYAADLAQLINQYREQNKLAPLAPNAQLTRLAHEHSARMATAKRMSHDGFEQRLVQSGFHHCVENVGNYPSAAAELAGWRRSTEHDRNLLDSRVTHMGIGVQATYVTFFACN